MRTAKAGLSYFALVFGAGFILGPIRILWVVPRLGERYAELLEMPIMFAITVGAARWTVRRFAVSRGRDRLQMGLLALALILLAEFALVPVLRGIPLRDYLATRDPVAGVAYYVMLGFFALMPVLRS